jgi:hypothetical protein
LVRTAFDVTFGCALGDHEPVGDLFVGQSQVAG